MLDSIVHISRGDVAHRRCKSHMFSDLWMRIGYGDMVVSNSLHSVLPPSRSLSFAAVDRESRLSSSSIRHSLTLESPIMSKDFPPGRIQTSSTVENSTRPFAVKPSTSPSLSQRWRNLAQPVARVFNSCVKREASGGVADLSAGLFRRNFSSWSIQMWRSCMTP